MVGRAGCLTCYTFHLLFLSRVTINFFKGKIQNDDLLICIYITYIPIIQFFSNIRIRFVYDDEYKDAQQDCHSRMTLEKKIKKFWEENLPKNIFSER